MADDEILKRICDETGASLEEALYYLEGFEWNLVVATEACRDKLLPLFKGKYSPEVSFNEKSAAEESSATMNSRQISNQSQWEDPPPQTQKELIDTFREVAPELSPQDAVDILKRLHWNVDQAASDFIEQKFSRHKSVSDEVDRSYLHRGHIPVLHLQSQFHASMCNPTQVQIGSSSSCSTNVESDEGYNPVRITSMSQVQMESSSPPPPSRQLLINSRRISNEMWTQPEQLPPEQEQLTLESRLKRIKTCCDTSKMSLDMAVSYLTRQKWNANNAINDFLEEDYSTMGQSISQWTSSQFQASSSMMNVDQTETEELLKEAYPPMMSSQVDMQNIQESRSPAQIREDTWVDRVCDETKVSREEALYYPERFKWNLGAAMAMSLTENIGLPLSSMGLPSQSQFQTSLPADVVEGILHRVPLSSLVRFRLSCKNWNSLFSVCSFIDKHLVNSQKAFLHARQSEIWVVEFGSGAQPSCRQIHDFRSETVRSMVECNGLILCGTTSRKLVILNHQSQIRWIDKNNLSLYDIYCLGHDSNMLYKVLKFNFGAFDRELDSLIPVAEICDLSLNCWRCIDIEDNWSVPLFQPIRIVSVHGDAYWIGSSVGRYFVQSFKFSTESFCPTKLPSELNGALALSSFRDGLSLLCQQPGSSRTDVWISKDGFTVWEKLFQVTDELIIYGAPSFLVREKKIIIFCEELVQNGAFARVKLLTAAEDGIQQTETEKYRYKTPSINCVYTPSFVPVPKIDSGIQQKRGSRT